MYKKLHCSVRLVFALSCIFCMLFSNTLSVSAAASYYDLFESTSPVDETAQSVSLSFSVHSTSNYMDISAGTFSGTTTGGASSYTGTVSMNGGTTSSSPSNSNWQWYGDRTGYLTAGGYNGTYSGSSGSITLTPSSTSSSTNINGSLSFNTTHGGSLVMHYKIPYIVKLPFVTDGSIDSNVYYGAILSPSAITTNVTNLHNISNFCITGADGTLFSNTTGSRAYYVLGSELLSNSNAYVVIPIFIEFDDCIFNMSGQTGAFTSTLTFTVTPRLRKIKENYQSQVGNNVTSDIIAHELQEESNAIQEEQKDIEEDTNNKITDFFGSFFSNLIGVFVPQDGYFENWFSRLNTMLNDKLGILYFPFNFFIELCTRLNTAFQNQGSTCVIHFPTISLPMNGQNYVIVEGQDVDLASYSLMTGRAFTSADTSNSSIVGSSGFTSFTQSIRRISSIVFVLAFLSLLRRKLNLIIRGADNDN